MIYRTLQKTDFPAVKALINESFGLYHYVKQPRIFNSWLCAYLQSCLAEATFACVAEQDGVPVGVIMGNAASDYHALQHWKPLVGLAYHSLCMNLTSRLTRCDFDGVNRMHQIYHELRSGCGQQFDGVLTLFVLAEDCRGRGVGKELLHRLISYQKEHGVTNSYLYTDTGCNVGFYEHQGFARLGEKEITLLREGIPATLGVSLYGYQVK